ncbi:hypothetical protein [Nocardia sp. IFM 10818]
MQAPQDVRDRRDDRPDVVDKTEAALIAGTVVAEAPGVAELLFVAARATLRGLANLLG